MAATVSGIHLGPDTHANRPAASAPPVGAFYYCTDHALVYKTDGATWTTYLDNEGAAVTADAAHVAAADPHTGYRLESADHSHASTGLQGGTVAHSALTGVTADQHHAQSHDHSAAGDGTSLSPASLILPVSASPAPTVEGSAMWDSALDLLAVGDGAATQKLYPQLSGAWTPTVTFVTPGDLSVVYSGRSARYIKMGKVVVCDFSMVCSTFTHTTASGDLRVTGLPFTSSSISLGYGSLRHEFVSLSSAQSILAEVGFSVTYAILRVVINNNWGTVINASHVPSGSTPTFRASITYQAA